MSDVVERLNKSLVAQKCDSYMDGSGRFNKGDVAEAAARIQRLEAALAAVEKRTIVGPSHMMGYDISKIVADALEQGPPTGGRDV